MPSGRRSGGLAYAKRRPTPDGHHGFDKIVVGDVILWNGKPRVVRDLERDSDGKIRTLTFAIWRPSWTDRPYTIYFRSEIKKHFGGIIGHKKSLCESDLECRTQREIEEIRTHSRRRYVRAREMAGVVP